MSIDSSASGSRSSSPRFHVMLRTLAPCRQRLATLEHVRRMIDGDDAAGPARGFDREVAFAAAEIRDVERRQQQPERPRPRRPAATRHELTALVPAPPCCAKLSWRNRRTLLQPGIVGASCPTSRVRTPREATTTTPPDRPPAHRIPGRGDTRRTSRRAARPRGRPRATGRDAARRPDCATPRIAVSSETLSASRDSSRRSRSRVSSPSSRSSPEA